MIFMWLSQRWMGLGHSTILKAEETPVPDSKSIPPSIHSIVRMEKNKMHKIRNQSSVTFISN